MEFSKLDILAIAKGLVPPEEEAVHGDATIAQKVTTPNLHELELSTHQAKDRRVRKVMNEFFRACIMEVKEQEIDLLKVLNLPRLNDVIRAELNDGDGPEEKYILPAGWWKPFNEVFDEWEDELLGGGEVKGLDAIVPTYMLRAFSIEIKKVEESLRKQVRSLSKAVTDPSLDNAYLESAIADAASRVRAPLSVAARKKIRKWIIKMAREGAYPMAIARKLHKSVGLGKAWWWNRIARSEARLAMNGAFDAAAKQYQFPYETWNLSPTACEICAQFKGGIWKATSGPQPVSDTHPHCTLGSTKIYTCEGWKKIRDIKIGDLVLSHKGKFQKVTKLHRHTEMNQKMVKLSYLNAQYSSKKVTRPVTLDITDNHPMLINDEWKNAGDVQVGDRVRLLATRCEVCGKLIPFSRWRDSEGVKAKYCSAKCTFLSVHREYGKDHLLKQFRINGKKLIEQGKHHFQIRNMSKLSNAGNSRIKYDTKAERILSDALNKADIVHKRQHMIKRPELRRCGKNGGMNRFYKIDMAIPELKIAIECDGEQWHRDSDYEKIRSTFIEEAGYSILRFNNNDIFNDVNKCVKQVQRLAMNHKNEYEFIDMKITGAKHYTKNEINLYNLSVEEDESYIAKGFVVHNCVCGRSPLIVLLPGQRVQRPWTRPSPYDKPYTPLQRRTLRPGSAIVGQS